MVVATLPVARIPCDIGGFEGVSATVCTGPHSRAACRLPNFATCKTFVNLCACLPNFIRLKRLRVPSPWATSVAKAYPHVRTCLSLAQLTLQPLARVVYQCNVVAGCCVPLRWLVCEFCVRREIRKLTGSSHLKAIDKSERRYYRGTDTQQNRFSHETTHTAGRLLRLRRRSR